MVVAKNCRYSFDCVFYIAISEILVSKLVYFQNDGVKPTQGVCKVILQMSEGIMRKLRRMDDVLEYHASRGRFLSLRATPNKNE